MQNEAPTVTVLPARGKARARKPVAPTAIVVEGQIVPIAEASKTRKVAAATPVAEPVAKVHKARSKSADRKIEVNPALEGRNPRREGTHGFHAFRLYGKVSTYGDYLKQGGGTNHFAWDVAHGFARFADEPFLPLVVQDKPAAK